MDASAWILLVQPACRAVLFGLLAGEVVGRSLEWLAGLIAEFTEGTSADDRATSCRP